MGEREKNFQPEAEEKPFSLNDIIDWDRLVPRDYKDLILGEPSGTKLRIRFSDWWDLKGDEKEGSEWKKIYSFLEERLRHQVLVDLGGGDIRAEQEIFGKKNYMYDLAKRCGAKAYINVDIQHPGEYPSPVCPTEEVAMKNFYEAVVKADMLDFIVHLKDNSANFTINGITGEVIGKSEYHKALARELVRATRKGGIIFGSHSVVGWYLYKISTESKLSSIRLIPEVDKEAARIFRPEHPADPSEAVSPADAKWLRNFRRQQDEERFSKLFAFEKL